VDSHQPLVSREECIREADGRLRYILTTKVPWLAPDGSVNGIIGIGRNITAIKEAEAELERVREDLRFKATHDSLTELLNREAILEMLTRELARTTREKGCLTVVLVDVDHFKSVNDTHGHQVGDAVLRETARRLQKAVRTYDLVGRYGGEEFLVILTNCAGPEAVLRANQMRHAVQELPMQTPGGDILMTISAGVLTTRERSDQTAEQILRDVDVALYEAKNAGRNCCRLARPARKSNS
jgi:diguanylate cyclase (GGDEF)-like protein